ncbi:MAG TPA: FAD-dependent oxidoreductase [Solirubrobacteraceae bacterium]|nr:FAD-dependent oxidoreductase [Solirubrobacteraceae bacterium]
MSGRRRHEQRAALGGEEPADFDLAVVGAGAAGLYSALCAARAGARVALISATPLAQAASYWAQGGLAAAVAPADSPARHLADTERAGRGAVRSSAARVLVEEAPERLRDLLALGVRFDADEHGELLLGLEGGHSAHRIVHAGGSATGRRLLRALSAIVVQREQIAIFEGAYAAELLLAEGRCVGLRATGAPPIRARALILATGGAAALWSRTTNPPGSLGSGMMLAAAAGAELADLELVQFHPTAVCGLPGREGFLITEAIRGEGATLHDAHGERFVDELAPRDEVSIAIVRRMAEQRSAAVYLDMRALDPARFPNVFSALSEAGLDPARQLVPVAPAAHYTIGGIRTDLDGRTTLPGLFAIGECSCTGLHGANRLASNSLSECFVFGARAAKAALDEPIPGPSAPLQRALAPAASPSAPQMPAPSAATRAALWRHAGVQRQAEGLKQLLKDEHPLARLVARCALARAESRGVHQRLDHPRSDPQLDRRHICVAADQQLRWERWE